MSKIQTAEELLKTIFIENQGAGGDSYNEGDIERIMIVFAKLHVQEALKQASEKSMLSMNNDCYGVDLVKETTSICKEQGFSSNTKISVDLYSILNAYPLENIK